MNNSDFAKRKTLREFTHDGAIIALWRLGLDTSEIAKSAGLPASQVANRLARLRDAGAA